MALCRNRSNGEALRQGLEMLNWIPEDLAARNMLMVARMIH